MSFRGIGSAELWACFGGGPDAWREIPRCSPAFRACSLGREAVPEQVKWCPSIEVP